eukprot:tig00020592_g11654.t1
MRTPPSLSKGPAAARGRAGDDPALVVSKVHGTWAIYHCHRCMAGLRKKRAYVCKRAGARHLLCIECAVQCVGQRPKNRSRAYLCPVAHCGEPEAWKCDCHDCFEIGDARDAKAGNLEACRESVDITTADWVLRLSARTHRERQEQGPRLATAMSQAFWMPAGDPGGQREVPPAAALERAASFANAVVSAVRETGSTPAARELSKEVLAGTEAEEAAGVCTAAVPMRALFLGAAGSGKSTCMGALLESHARPDPFCADLMLAHFGTPIPAAAAQSVPASPAASASPAAAGRLLRSGSGASASPRAPPAPAGAGAGAGAVRWLLDIARDASATVHVFLQLCIPGPTPTSFRFVETDGMGRLVLTEVDLACREDRALYRLLSLGTSRFRVRPVAAAASSASASAASAPRPGAFLLQPCAEPAAPKWGASAASVPQRRPACAAAERGFVGSPANPPDDDLLTYNHDRVQATEFFLKVVEDAAGGGGIAVELRALNPAGPGVVPREAGPRSPSGPLLCLDLDRPQYLRFQPIITVSSVAYWESGGEECAAALELRRASERTSTGGASASASASASSSSSGPAASRRSTTAAAASAAALAWAGQPLSHVDEDDFGLYEMAEGVFPASENPQRTTIAPEVGRSGRAAALLVCRRTAISLLELRRRYEAALRRGPKREKPAKSATEEELAAFQAEEEEREAIGAEVAACFALSPAQRDSAGKLRLEPGELAVPEDALRRLGAVERLEVHGARLACVLLGLRAAGVLATTGEQALPGLFHAPAPPSRAAAAAAAAAAGLQGPAARAEPACGQCAEGGPVVFELPLSLPPGLAGLTLLGSPGATSELPAHERRHVEAAAERSADVVLLVVRGKQSLTDHGGKQDGTPSRAWGDVVGPARVPLVLLANGEAGLRAAPSKKYMRDLLEPARRAIRRCVASSLLSRRRRRDSIWEALPRLGAGPHACRAIVAARAITRSVLALTFAELEQQPSAVREKLWDDLRRPAGAALAALAADRGLADALLNSAMGPGPGPASAFGGGGSSSSSHGPAAGPMASSAGGGGGGAGGPLSIQERYMALARESAAESLEAETLKLLGRREEVERRWARRMTPKDPALLELRTQALRAFNKAEWPGRTAIYRVTELVQESVACLTQIDLVPKKDKSYSADMLLARLRQLAGNGNARWPKELGPQFTINGAKPAGQAAATRRGASAAGEAGALLQGGLQSRVATALLTAARPLRMP